MAYKDNIDKALKHFHLADLIKFQASFELQKHEVKKNRRKIMINRKTRKPFIGKSDGLQQSELILIQRLIQHRLRQLSQPIDGDLWMIAIFETKRSVLMAKTGIRKKTTANLSNLVQIVEDCLQKTKVSKRGKLISRGAGIINDDDQIQSLDWSRIVAGDSTKLHLYLLSYEESQKRLGLT